MHKRQSNTNTNTNTNTYLTPTSPISNTTCSYSTASFTITNGQLSTSDGRFLSTTDGVTWMAFQASSPAEAISTQFTIDGNGYLVWSNSAFVGDTALFCEDEETEQINVLFRGETDASDESYPDYGMGCAPVDLMIVDEAAASTGTCPVYPESWRTYSIAGLSCVPRTVIWTQKGCVPSPVPYLSDPRY
ncbi:uncharacterized protein LY89DRAFT_675187 [Mollisia scopiformis]|uniref:DUF7908 domain-containing protein n=1 Tax=Mollisia scopiformis TaxID=149040 RepID=A0A132BD59_MOLSC|nr:uncharacterized protein LY89DRAFT_675187 [Mollisia scopiformis]KUJ10336.1 hypothetical protein LY89DRAFT_675187 [Mollisia scopiformis]